MLQQSLSEIFTRDLGKLKAEIAAYENEQHLWLVPDGISNSAGNLTLHLVGNLNHFIGAVLGHTGYVRQRDLEFSLKDIPKATLLADIDKTTAIVKATIDNLQPGRLVEMYPEDKFKDPVTVQFLLLHLLSHLNYHVGQINYHRRLV